MITIWTKVQKILSLAIIVTMISMLFIKNTLYAVPIIILLISSSVYLEYKNVKNISNKNNIKYNEFAKILKVEFITNLIFYNMLFLMIPFSYLNILYIENDFFFARMIYTIIIIATLIFSAILRRKKKKFLLNI